MHTLKPLVLKLSAVFILVLSSITTSNTQELETSNFSGSVNTTITSGLTIRTERNCSNLDGYSYTGPVGTYVDGSGAGCATALTDAYGNTTTKQLSRSSGQADDGNMNFDNGSVISAKQKFYTEVVGTFSSGIGANLSFTGFVDPTLDINSAEYSPFTETARDDFERGLDVLNAYVTGSADTGESYIDWTVGRHVTNWGEATFIPIGMNGFTTNALDLTKLRGPGSSIREALVPTGQVSLSTSLGDGLNLEGFYQLEHRAVQLDPAGSFYGNEVVGPGSSKMITNGNYNKENVTFDDCNYSHTGTTSSACNAALIASFRTTSGVQAHDTNYLLTIGLQQTSRAEAAAGQIVAAAKTFGKGNLSTSAGAAWTDAYTAGLNTYLGSATANGVAAGGNSTISATGVDKTFYSSNTVGYNLQTLAGVTVNSYAADDSGAQTFTALGNLNTDVVADSLNTYAAVSIRRADDFIKEARSDGQFGLKLSGYSDAGDGFDWALNYSRYHSKTPYVRMIGQGGIYSGDIFGILNSAKSTAEGSRSTAQANIVKAITNAAYSAGVCNAAFGAALAKATYSAADSDGTYWSDAQKLLKNYDGTLGNWGSATTEQKNLSDQYNWQETINGKQVHNPAKCYATATGFGLASSAAYAAGDVDEANFGLSSMHDKLYEVGEVLISAITPLNLTKYELIYPEDLNAMGFSFNTYLDGTAVQGEIVYRPNFPLAHNAGDQVAQIGDVTGAFDMLDMFAFDTVANKITNNTNDDGTDQDTIVAGVAISPNFYNPDTSGLTATEIFQQGVRMSLIGRANWNGTGFTITDTTTLGGGDGLAIYKNWMASESAGTAQILGLAGVRKGIFDAAYVAACSNYESATTCAGETLGAGDYNTSYYNGIAAVHGAYEYGTVAFNRSSLPALSKANTVSNYYSTPFVEKDVWTYDLGTTTTFSASHPITTMLGADSVAFLTEVGAVMIVDMDNATDGYIARNGYQEGIGQEKCNGPFGAAVAGGTSFGGAAGGLTHLGAGQVDALFGNGGYCEDQNGADDLSLSYRLIGVATYNNFSNTGWSVTPSVVWAHDPYGYGPSSMGGFVEDKMTFSLSVNAKKSDALSLGVSYVSHLAGPEVDASSDKDTLTMSMSYSF
jgi:hypothetical protein